MAKIKYKEKTSKVKREKQLVAYKGIATRVLPDFSADTLQDRKEWNDTIKTLKEKKKKNPKQKTSNKEYPTQQRCPSEIKEK